MGQGKSILASAALALWTSLGIWAAPPSATIDRAVDTAKVKADLFGDPLPERAIARMGSTFLRHAGSIENLAFSADGKILASGDMFGTVHIWDLARSRHISEVWGGFDEQSLALSPDGQLLATGSAMDNDVRLWNSVTGREVAQLSCKSSPKSLLFAPDGNFLAVGSSQGDIYFWDVPSGQLRAQLRGHDGCIRALAFSRDSLELASGGDDKTICIWELPAGTRVKRLTGYKREIRFLSFSPDGSCLMSIGDDEGYLGGGLLEAKSWEATTGKITNELPDNYFGRYPGVLSPDWQVVACGGESGRILLLRAGSADISKSWRAHSKSVKVLKYSPDGKILASSGDDNTIHLWDSVTGKEIAWRLGHQSQVTAVGFLPGGERLLSMSSDGSARVWEMRTGKQIRRISIDPGRIFQGSAPLGLVPGTSLFVAGNTEVNLVDADSGKIVREIHNQRLSLTTPAMSANGKLVVVGDFEGRVQVVEVKTGRKIRSLNLVDKPGVAALALAFSPDASLLASTHRLRFAAGDPSGVCLTDVATGKVLRRLEVNRAKINCLVFSPDGKMLATGCQDGTIGLWQVATGKEYRRIHHDRDLATCLAFSADGKMLASGSGGGLVYLWEVSTGQERARFPGHTGNVTSVAFAQDGRTLASGGDDTTALVWDVMGAGPDPSKPVGASNPGLDMSWADLQSLDAQQAFDALRFFVSRPKKAVTYLAKVFHPAEEWPAGKIAALLPGLDDVRFQVRMKAFQDLAELGEAAGPVLRQALQDKLSLESRRRIEQLLEQLDPARSRSRLRALRAIEALEYIGTPEAKQLLTELARGAKYARQTEEAQAAQQRLNSK